MPYIPSQHVAGKAKNWCQNNNLWSDNFVKEEQNKNKNLS